MANCYPCHVCNPCITSQYCDNPNDNVQSETGLYLSTCDQPPYVTSQPCDHPKDNNQSETGLPLSTYDQYLCMTSQYYDHPNDNVQSEAGTSMSTCDQSPYIIAVTLTQNTLHKLGQTHTVMVFPQLFSQLVFNYFINLFLIMYNGTSIKLFRIVSCNTATV